MAKSNGNGATLGSALHGWFTNFAQAISRITGHPFAFLTALLIVVVWAATGPLFGYSDTWQLVINTGTTIVTFLMVFLIQNTQNRDTLALHLKMSEMIFAQKGAKNKYAALEQLSEEELEALHAEFCKRAAHAQTLIHAHQRRQRDTTRRARKSAKRRGRS